MKHFLIFIFATVLVLKSCESNSVTTETPFYDIQIFRNNECSNGKSLFTLFNFIFS